MPGSCASACRGIYEIPGRGYGDNPGARVQVVSGSRLAGDAGCQRRRVPRLRAGQAPWFVIRSRWCGPMSIRPQPVRPRARLLRASAAAHRHACPQAPARGGLGSQGDTPMKTLSLAGLGALLALSAHCLPMLWKSCAGSACPLAVPWWLARAHRVHRPQRPGRRALPVWVSGCASERRRRGVSARQRGHRADPGCSFRTRTRGADPAGHCRRTGA